MTLIWLWAGCCGQEPPQWMQTDVFQADPEVEVDLADYVSDDGDEIAWWVTPEDGVSATMDGSVLTLVGAPGFEGYTHVEVIAADACGNEAATTLSVEVSNTEDTGTTQESSCGTRFEYVGAASTVQVAGSFSDWAPVDLSLDAGGWSVELEIDAGDHPYKFIVDGQWVCDANADFYVCEDGQSWDPSCPAGGNGCNSVVHVADCAAPQITLDALTVDRAGLGIIASGRVDGTMANPWITLDGEEIDGWSGTTFSVDVSGLTPGRHTLRVGGDDAEVIHVPVWLDGRRWDEGLLYFAFVDRFADGASPNETEGADVDYLGGDWDGVREHLADLDAMGVTTIWLTAPVDNAEGTFEGDCGATFTGYHGYWPDDTGLEEHFGDETSLRALIDEAHARDLRVMVDWVANHVHEDHPWVSEHPDWFNDEYICDADEDGDGVVNWDQRTETCWFDSFLPDIDYRLVEPNVASIDEALRFAKDYDIDGMRVDAVKHLPIAYWWNLQSRIRNEVEHVGAGGDEDFRLVGETFDGSDKIASYLDERLLDAQFDFPLYWAVVQAFARDEIGLSNGDGSLQATLLSSQSAYNGALMSTFLGNHDVSRFIAHASGEVSNLYGDGNCDDDGLRDPDTAPSWSDPYDRLRLAWSFLLTTEGQPLVYYGDEIGLPGYTDPDNRQMMRWGDELSDDEAAVLAHVQRLGQARRTHPAMSHGTRVDWWSGEADVWAYARVQDDDQVLVILNRGTVDRTFTNGLSWAGLSTGTWEDVLTGATFVSDGDSLTVDVSARDARVLVRQ